MWGINYTISAISKRQLIPKPPIFCNYFLLTNLLFVFSLENIRLGDFLWPEPEPKRGNCFGSGKLFRIPFVISTFAPIYFQIEKITKEGWQLAPDIRKMTWGGILYVPYKLCRILDLFYFRGRLISLCGML